MRLVFQEPGWTLAPWHTWLEAVRLDNPQGHVFIEAGLRAGGATLVKDKTTVQRAANRWGRHETGSRLNRSKLLANQVTSMNLFNGLQS